MNPFVTLGEAWRALGANRLRTVLTMLGMIIGVSAVVLMLAIGEGAKQSVNRSMQSMGSNLFIVLSGSTSAGGLRSGMGTSPTVTLKDAEAIGKIPSIAASAPIYTGNAQVILEASNWSTQITGVTPDYMVARSWSIEDGEMFNDADVRNATRNAIVGQTVIKNIFSGDHPIGKTIRIKNLPFVVTGTLAAKGQGFDGRDQDDTVLVPITTAQGKLFGNPFPGTVRFISVQAKSAEVMDEAEEEIKQLLRQRHRIQPGGDDDFTVRNLTAAAQTASAAAQAMSMMLGAIGSISLLVGGIGIMNIMLVSVTERTREIGVRMAIGARRWDILLQFLLEAVIISVIGGLIGVALGAWGAYGAAMGLGMEVELSGGAMLVAFAVAATIGIFFGLYPARRAAKLRPVEALRYE
jgi:putative ABC transport system permease protein